MVDADHFKRINDNYGHEAGDICLQTLAELMRKHFRRETDRLSRFGGEEFVILLYGTSGKEAEAFFERAAQCKFQIKVSESEVVPIEYSVGWVEWHEDITSVQEWLDRADEEMYGKKHCRQAEAIIDRAV
jgi:diguanylate cyclase (GGDEF)-like protein